MATALVALLFVGALFLLARVELPAKSTSPAQQSSPGSPGGAPEQSADTEIEYTFHSRLEDFEIEVRSSERARRVSAQLSYLVQAGSFKTREQAERRLVELKLLGLDPRIDERVNRDGSRWQRVLLGPYDSRSRMSGVRNVLLSNDIEAMVMQRKPG